jgi:cysteine desulfurase family protein (TIGR01976 family)
MFARQFTRRITLCLVGFKGRIAMSNAGLKQDGVLDVAWVRSQFPSLETRVNGHAAAFLDGPAGTQVPVQVIAAIRDYFVNSNANTHGAFLTSQRSDELIANTRGAMADFLNCSPREVVFGPNMTTLTFALSRAIGRELREGDEILLTTLDHDANFSPWKALEEKGVVIKVADIREDDCTLNLEDLKSKLSRRTRIVAVGYASNAVGTINPVREITRLAHAVGAMTFVDAVHYAPHGLIDMKALDCDFLVCSPYKFFGPHMGVLCGKKEHLERLQPYKVRPSSDEIPDRWETGTQTHELIAGVGAAVEYIASVGRHSDPSAKTRREALTAAYRTTVAYERRLITKLIEGLKAIPGVRIYGITDPERFDERCSTLSLRIADHSPKVLAEYLGAQGILAWDGNYYAINLAERLQVQQKGGMLRIGPVHYNTDEEAERLLSALCTFVSQNG